MSEETGPTVVCSNCDRELPEEKLFLHEAYCIRNIIRCPKCNEPIDKNEKDAHEEEVHRISACKHCKRDMENKLLEEHEEKCNAKPKLCTFCNCEIAGEEFSHHTYQCGSRTKKCIYCNKNILVRDYDDHEPVCQVNQQNFESNFPAMQEEAKADKPKNVAPYSSISSKYVQNPSANPYDVLTQETKSKPKERPESKVSSSKPTHHAREEERKPSSITTSTSHKSSDQKHTSITSKPLTSVKPDLNNYDKIGLTSQTKPSVPISHKAGVSDYTSHMRAPETTTTTAYTAQTSSSSNYRHGASDPRSHIADDKHALSSYLSNKYQEPGKHSSKSDITDPLKSKYTSGYSKPTDLHAGVSSKYGTSGISGGVSGTSGITGISGVTGTRPSMTESTKTSVRTGGVSSLGSKVPEPTSTKPTESRSHKPIFPEKTTASTQKTYVPITGTGISSKDITSYSTGISSKPRTESKPSDPLPKKTTGTSGTSGISGISGISGVSGIRPSGLTQASGKSTKPTGASRTTHEDLDTQVARALEAGYHHKGTSGGRSQPRSQQAQQPSRNVQPNYEDYGHYGGGDAFGGEGEDAELQKAIQESYGNSRKAAAPESRHKPSSNRQPAPSQQNFGYEDYGVGGEDDELQKAIQESLKNSHPTNARNGPNDTWNDETFKKIMERSKHDK